MVRGNRLVSPAERMANSRELVARRVMAGSGKDQVAGLGVGLGILRELQGGGDFLTDRNSDVIAGLGIANGQRFAVRADILPAATGKFPWPCAGQEIGPVIRSTDRRRYRSRAAFHFGKSRTARPFCSPRSSCMSTAAAGLFVREARRQKGLDTVQVPPVCLLDPDGDIVRRLRQARIATPFAPWACYHTELDVFDLGGHEVGIVGRAVGASFAVLVAEELFASGCRILVSLTSAGQ